MTNCWLRGRAILAGMALVGLLHPVNAYPGAQKHASRGAGHRSNRAGGLPPGTPKVWEERGELTPAKVYWGFASTIGDPLSRVPAPPFSHFEKFAFNPNSRSPKAKLTDSKGVKWTVKFGEEV